MTNKQYFGAFVAVLLAFWFGKGYGSDQTRPDEHACAEYVTALTNGMYAWRDAAIGLANPRDYSDPLDRTVGERAQAGEDLLKQSETLARRCSIQPIDLGGPGDY